MPVSLANAAISALMQLMLFGGIPLLAYFSYQRLRNKRSWPEIAKRAGLRSSPWRYVLYSLGFTLISVSAILIWPPPLDAFTREGTALHDFAGLDPGLHAFALAFLYAAIKTGLAEEILFRGLIAGSLSRRLPIALANVAQALIFLLPHFLILIVMPEMWMLLPVVFATALVMGWIRIKSGSIVGPWLIHTSTNLAVALSIMMRTAA